LFAYRSQIARSVGQMASRVDRFVSFYHDKLMRHFCIFYSLRPVIKTIINDQKQSLSIIISHAVS